MMVRDTATAPAFGLHPTQPAFALIRLAFVQPQSMSRARVIVLIVLVVFMSSLFIAAYVWMRRPNFGQGDSTTPDGQGKVVGEGIVPPVKESSDAAPALRIVKSSREALIGTAGVATSPDH
jgi:hypothetical protein